MPVTPTPPPSARPRTIPTLMYVLAAVALLAAVGWLTACDAPADQGVRRDQLGSDLRTTSVPRFNTITILPPAPSSSGSTVTLTADGSISTVELVDGVATCMGSGATLDDVHLIGADLKSGTITLTASGSNSLTCEAHEIGHIANRPPGAADNGTYSLWVGDVSP